MALALTLVLWASGFFSPNRMSASAPATTMSAACATITAGEPTVKANSARKDNRDTNFKAGFEREPTIRC